MNQGKLGRWATEAKAHLLKYRPKMAAELDNQGKLNDWAELKRSIVEIGSERSGEGARGGSTQARDPTVERARVPTHSEFRLVFSKCLKSRMSSRGCCLPNISSILTDHDELFALPGYPREGGSPDQSAGDLK
jgi:hypothetical protein